MEKLRRHLTANRFTETEFVDILLRGMNLPQPYANMMSFPGTIDELKDRMHRFEDELTAYANMPAAPMTRSAAPTIRSAAPMTRSADSMTQSAAPMTQSAAKPMPAANTEANTRCYNCCKLGHYQSRCPYEKRPSNSCFKCWGMGHSHRECPNPQRILLHSNSRVPIAATADPTSDDYEPPEATYISGVNIVNMVSAKLLDFMTAGTRFNNFPSLFDTGSPVSFIRFSSLSDDAVKLLNNVLLREE